MMKLNKPNKSRVLLFGKVHEDVKKGMNEHMEKEKREHEQVLQQGGLQDET